MKANGCCDLCGKYANLTTLSPREGSPRAWICCDCDIDVSYSFRCTRCNKHFMPGDVVYQDNICNKCSKEGQMKDKTLEKDKVLTISKKAVLECAEECEDFKRIAQKLWPDEIEDHKNITKACTISNVCDGRLAIFHGVYRVCNIDEVSKIGTEYYVEGNEDTAWPIAIYKK